MNVPRRVALLSFIALFFTLLTVVAAASHWRAVTGWTMALVFLATLGLIAIAALEHRFEKCPHCKKGWWQE